MDEGKVILMVYVATGLLGISFATCTAVVSYSDRAERRACIEKTGNPDCLPKPCPEKP